MKKWFVRGAFTLAVAVPTMVIAALHAINAYFHTDDPPNAGRHSYSTVNGIEISYLRVEGTGPRVIFIHGTPGDASDFAAYLAEPVGSLDLVSVDRPGFGRTRPRKPVPSIEEQAALFEPLLEERDGAWPILVGHSLGAAVVCRMAVNFPDRVGGLVLLSASVDPGEERIHWYQQIADLWVVSKLLPAALRNANRELFPFGEELEQLEPLLGEIRVPVVVLHAPDDSLVPVSNVDYLRNTLPAGSVEQVVLLDGKDHFLPWNAEEDVRNAILLLVEKLTNARATESKSPPR